MLLNSLPGMVMHSPSDMLADLTRCMMVPTMMRSVRRHHLVLLLLRCIDYVNRRCVLMAWASLAGGGRATTAHQAAKETRFSLRETRLLYFVDYIAMSHLNAVD